MPRILLPALALPAALLAACANDTPLDNTPPGLAPPSCAMSFATYRIDGVTLPSTLDDQPMIGLDLDRQPGDSYLGIDNQLGRLHALLVQTTEAWNVNPAIAGHLEAGAVHWVLELGRCLDGGDEVRVHLSRARDLDGDGVLELVDRGVAAVGTADRRIDTEHGVALVPLGFLTDGGGTYATDAWQTAFALTTSLAVLPDGRLDGMVGFGLGRFQDQALAPLAAYATGTLDENTSTADFWRSEDADRDGTISPTEIRRMVELLMTPDLDLGACDEPACYQVVEDDGVRDHYSVGLAITASPVAIE